MSFTFAQFLLNQTKECNGHLQATATGISIEDGMQLCKELEALTGNQHSFILEVWSDGSYTIYEVDFWDKGEHPLGHLHRMILGVSNS
jgi:hypothetical protein